VDDNPEVAAFAAAMLEGMGYTALRAESGAEALAILGSGRRVDALFSDIVMPGLSGAELATIVRERYPKIAIVLATGYSEQRSALGQSVEVLDKPYRQNDLGRALERALDAASRDFRTA
jgi:CheY-like chemotaxis protein